MICDCYKIGGLFVAEDPDCPVHGKEAQERKDRVAIWKEDIRHSLSEATTLEDLKSIIRDLLELID